MRKMLALNVLCKSPSHNLAVNLVFRWLLISELSGNIVQLNPKTGLDHHSTPLKNVFGPKILRVPKLILGPKFWTLKLA